MKALLLAAGKGTRISRYLGGNPKCTVNIGDEILIHYTVSLLKKKGINDIGIVVGYQDDVIKEVLSDEKTINFFYNPFYEITNSLASAWFARDFIDDNMLIMNADVFLEEALLDDILNCKISPVLFSDETRKEEADFKLFYKDGLLIDYGKELEVEKTTGEYIGVVTFNKSFVETFKTNMCKMIKEKKYLDLYVGELNKVLIDVLEENQLNELGLLRGELGIFYSLICSAEKNYKNLLKKMLIDRINKYLFTKNYENQFPLTKRGFIYSPYIDFGSAGLLKVLIKYSSIYNDNYFYNYIYNIADELKKTNFTQNATYGKGMSGIIDALLDFYELTKDTECLNNVKEKIKQLDYYIIECNGDYYISSNTFQSAGLDYYSGSAGVISTYNRYIKLIGGEEHV